MGIDLTESPRPEGCWFVRCDVLKLGAYDLRSFDFICASSPCEEFAIHGMRNFHPIPAYPEKGIELFEHTRRICEESGIPYVMENVRPARNFVGPPVSHCGPFYLWGTGVPPLMPQGITKGFGAWDRKYILTTGSSKSRKRAELKAKWATIQPELASCVADYATRICTSFARQSLVDGGKVT